MTQHAQFREWILNNAIYMDNFAPAIIEQFDKLPDVEEEINSSVQLAKANFAAELEKWLKSIEGDGQYDYSVRFSEIRNKLKELSDGK